jgi:hypothetical protein
MADLIHYATFETFPCVYTSTHAWVAYADAPWKEWPLAEVHQYAHVLSEDAFKRRFPHLVMPKAALHAGE